MEVENFICKKCSFVAMRLEELNSHIESIHASHNLSNKKQEPNSLTGFYTEEAFDRTLDALETRNSLAKVKIVLTAVVSEAPKTKHRRKKATKDSFGFCIVDMRKFPSWQSTENMTYWIKILNFSAKIFGFYGIKEMRNNLLSVLFQIVICMFSKRNENVGEF